MKEVLARPSGGDQNRASAILATLWAPYPIVVILIAARIFVRVKIQSLGLDDFLMFLAWVSVFNNYTSLKMLTIFKITITLGDSLSSYYLVRGGGRHLFYLNPDQITLILKYSFISSLFGLISSVFGKSSVAIFLLRIIGPVTIWRKRLIYGNFILYWATTVVLLVIIIARCSPVRSFWEQVPGSKCLNPHVEVGLGIFQGGKNPLRVALDTQALTSL